MDKAKQWVALAAVAALALLAGGWFLLISPQRSEAALLQEQQEAQEAQNDQLRTQLEVLRAKAAGLPAQKAELAQVAAKIPDTPELAALLRALTAAGRTAGVRLDAITPSAAVAAAGAGAAETTTPEAAAEGALTAIPLTMRVSGDFYSLEQFVAGLEDLPRALRVTSLTLEDADDSGGRSLSSTVNASVFVRGAAPAAAPAAPAAPAAGGTAPAAPVAEGATVTPSTSTTTAGSSAAAPSTADAGAPVS